MSEGLYSYYERELIFIRQLAQEFSRKYPAIAGQLLLESNRSADPHVERMIEAFALLTGRIQRKLDDEFPELNESLLSVLYPHYLAPIPSMAMVQFELDYERVQLPRGFLIDRESPLSTPPLDGVPCRYRTAYPVVLWPVVVTGARVLTPPFPGSLGQPPGTAAVIRLQLEARGMSLQDMELDRLRFHLHGDATMIASLYGLLFHYLTGIAIRSPDLGPGGPTIHLEPASCLAPVGFEADEGLLPYRSQAFVGYRLLTEFFTFPSKFQFVDLLGLGRMREAGFTRRFEILLYLDRTAANVEQGVDAETFLLGCSPIVNLFEQTAEPIVLNQAKYEYRVIPDVAVPMGMEVHTIESVTGVDPVSRLSTEYQPFYSFRHGGSRESRRAFWNATRKPSLREGDRGFDLFVSLSDLDLDPRLPAESTLVVRTLCTNRDLPAKLASAGERLVFSLEAAAPLSRIRCLRLPTPPLRPSSRKGYHWRLISHLNLNHLSLADGDEGLAALQEILRLYDFADPEASETLATVNREIIDGIVALRSRPVTRWLDSAEASGFCRGVEIQLDFDESKYAGTGVYLFAAVLERFLGLYTTLNTFTQLVSRTRQAEGFFKRWPPRAGEHPLI